MEKKSPKIGIYAGAGTSHSWLWFADLFEKARFFDLVFLDEFSVRANEIKGLDVLVISGGDTFAVAKSLGKKGSLNISSFVEQGGIYIGSCAGAYLPMKSSKPPLDLFNFADVKITNLSKTLPPAEQESCKFFTTYGCDFVFHPVREAVTLETTSFFDAGSAHEFDAPLYGGPGMTALDPAWVLGIYKNFTPKTSYLASRETAQKTLINHAAIVRVPFKRGCFYLLGPHLEHPGFKTANRFVIDVIVKEWARIPDSAILQNRPCAAQPNEQLAGKPAKDLLLTIRRELSNARIAASGLEFLPIQWLIGKKVYEPLKIRVYLESMWKRLRRLEKEKMLWAGAGETGKIVTAADSITYELRRIKQQLDNDQDSLDTAIRIFEYLHIFSISFFNLYFQTLSGSGNNSCCPVRRDPVHADPVDCISAAKL